MSKIVILELTSAYLYETLLLIHRFKPENMFMPLKLLLFLNLNFLRKQQIVFQTEMRIPITSAINLLRDSSSTTQICIATECTSFAHHSHYSDHGSHSRLFLQSL